MNQELIWPGCRATLIGLGLRTHVALARYLVGRGVNVRISERQSREQLGPELALLGDLPVELALGGHATEDVADADVVFVTPGAPRDLPVLDEARRRGIPLSSEIELLFRCCRAPIIGITGSAGKTTTTTLVGKMLEAEGRSVFVGGNIGLPLIERVDDLTPADWVVLELSSFQLEALTQSPTIGVILNVTPNHLDRHPTFEHYRESKFNLLRQQSAQDQVILGADDPVAASLAVRCAGQVRWFGLAQQRSPGAMLVGENLVLRDEAEEVVCARAELVLPGRHNVANVLAASAIARAAGVSVGSMRAVATTFRGVEHRLELTRMLGGVAYVNDSIATSPERASAALRAIKPPIVLIAGGRSKHLAMDEMAALIVDHVVGLVTLGEMAGEIEEAVRTADPTGRVPIERAASLGDAVSRARRMAEPGATVLLSPAGTSYDLFRDFEERGHSFKALVEGLR